MQLKCGTSGNAVPTMLLKCGTAGNAVPTLLRACPPPAPKYICTEFGLDPSLALKFTWSGTLNRCTECWDINERNHWGCTAAPTSLPNFTNSLSCLGPSAALPSQIRLDFYFDYCGGWQGYFPEQYIYYSDSEAYCYWDCVDGLFRLAVLSKNNFFPLFYSAGYNVKDGDVLPNLLTCLGWPTLPCGTTLSFPAFVTGGSYKVEIVVP